MPNQPDFPLRIYYDGACSVCAIEIEHYGRLDRDGRLILVDISAADFDPTPLGLTLDELMDQMHAIDRAGTVYRNVEAFWAIWQAFPASTFYGLLGAMIALPPVKPFARLGYWAFARIRRFLPRRSPPVCRIGRRPG